MHIRLMTCVAMVVTAAAQAVAAQPVDRPASSLPSNVETALPFRFQVEDMWRSSPTFREQCARVAAARLRVRILADDQLRPAATFTARSRVTRRGGALVAADVYLRWLPNLVELIAHELEHIIEQLDGVDLPGQLGTGAVWTSGDGAFETRRAIAAGRRVAQEVMTTAGSRDPSLGVPDPRQRIIANAVQRDRDALPASARSARVSGDGRTVVFTSSAGLVAADRNAWPDVYVLDLASREIELASVSPAGLAGNGWSAHPDISADGRYVVFESIAGDLTDGAAAPGPAQVVLRDRDARVTRLLSASVRGGPANRSSRAPAISADATTVVFESSATDLEPAGASAVAVGVYLVRLPASVPRRVDVSSTGRPGTGHSVTPAVSADGRLVAFMSTSDLTCADAVMCGGEAPDRNGVGDIYLHDTQTARTMRVTRRADGGDADGVSHHPALSGDGRVVAFVSEASNLTRDVRRRAAAQVYVSDISTGVTELVSATPRGRAANGPSAHPALSYDGAIVAFQSLASDLHCDRSCGPGPADINLLWDVFVRDRAAGHTMGVSRSDDGPWMDNSRAPSVDDHGCIVTFGSRHPIDDRDREHDEDLFIVALGCPGPR